MRVNKKTKIVATIGPASESMEVLRKMIKSGMNVARLNFSHGEHSWHKQVIKTIRQAADDLGANVGILADLQGPRIRIHTSQDIELRKGEEVLVSDIKYKKVISDFSSKIFYLDHPGIIDGIEAGNEILIEDGIIKIRISKKEKNLLRAEVIDPGVVKNHKGVNLPGAKINIGVITSKDEKDLKFALDEDVDFVALSFVSSAKDIRNLRKKIGKKAKRKNSLPQIVAKIERKEAIDNLEEIIEESDVIMVARGDLGIEMNESKVVLHQKNIIIKSLKRTTPVIVATQMLNSMIENPRPTRAEVSDVCNAVIDHADAVMLSGESANGKYPIESVKAMNEIIESTEQSPFDDIYKTIDIYLPSEYAAVIRGAYELANSYGAKAIALMSLSGFTARLISHFRPDQKLIVATNNRKTFNQFSLLWGVEGYLFPKSEKLDGLIEKMIEKAKKEKKINKGDDIVLFVGRDEKRKKVRLVGVRKA